MAKVKGKGKSKGFGDMPFQLGEDKRWFSDSRPKGKTSFKKGKKGK